MTVLVFDGNTFAADKRATNQGLIFSVTKIKKSRDHLIGVSGDFSAGKMLMKWFEDGCDPTKWPKCQEDKDRWTSLIVITPENKILKYEQEPIPMEVEEKRFAFGSGRDLALAAMEMGADAIKAVEVASKFDAGCGNGIDTLRFS